MKEALNIASQCRATASHDLACNIVVDGGSGLLRELLIDAAMVIEALAHPERGPEQVLDKLFEVENELGVHYDEKPTQDGSVCARCGGIVFDPVLAQPEQEPVARVIDDGSPEGATEWIPFAKRVEPLKTGDLLYTALPQRPWGKPWVSLTDEDLEFWTKELGQEELGRGVLRAVADHLKKENT